MKYMFIFFVLFNFGCDSIVDKPTLDEIDDTFIATEKRVFAKYGCRCAQSESDSKGYATDLIKSLAKELGISSYVGGGPK